MKVGTLIRDKSGGAASHVSARNLHIRYIAYSYRPARLPLLWSLYTFSAADGRNAPGKEASYPHETLLATFIRTGAVEA